VLKNLKVYRVHLVQTHGSNKKAQWNFCGKIICSAKKFISLKVNKNGLIKIMKSLDLILFYSLKNSRPHIKINWMIIKSSYIINKPQNYFLLFSKKIFY
jgi:hypothetical protein